MSSRVRHWLPALVLTLLLALGDASVVRADQKHSELDELFRQLEAAQTLQKIGEIETRIWRHWYSSGSEATDEMFRRGDMALGTGRFRQSLVIFNEIIARRPDMSEGWNRRATLLYLMGDYEGSIRDIAETLAREPRHFGALSGLGLCHLKLGNKKEALQAFQQALVYHPHMPSAKREVERLRIEVYGPET